MLEVHEYEKALNDTFYGGLGSLAGPMNMPSVLKQNHAVTYSRPFNIDTSAGVANIEAVRRLIRVSGHWESPDGGPFSVGR